MTPPRSNHGVRPVIVIWLKTLRRRGAFTLLELLIVLVHNVPFNVARGVGSGDRVPTGADLYYGAFLFTAGGFTADAANDSRHSPGRQPTPLCVAPEARHELDLGVTLSEKIVN